MRITNLVYKCGVSRGKELDLTQRSLTVFHRISFSKDDGSGLFKVDPIPDKKLTALGVAERFRDRRKVEKGKRHWADRPGSYTSGLMPYGIIIKTDGEIQQAVAFSEQSPHAKRWNTRGFGIGVVGDFRLHCPTAEQWISCIELGALLHAWGCQEAGHTELDGSSNQPEKECPGQYFDMHALRDGIRQHPFSKLQKAEAWEELIKSHFDW